MKVIEVQFDGHVRVPGSMRGTNVLRTEGDAKLGGSVLVDSLTEGDRGITAVKTIEKDDKRITYRKLYPWVSITEVLYESDVVDVKPVKSDSSQSQVKKS